jgi:hypothetical protein
MIGDSDNKIIVINGVEIEYRHGDYGTIQFCSDWAELVTAAHRGDKRIKIIHRGPGTYCHTDYAVIG